MVVNPDPFENPEIDLGTSGSPTNIGSGGATFESGTQKVDGDDLTMTVTSSSSADFNVKVEWLNADENVRREEAPPSLQGVNDIGDALITIKGNRFNLKIEDASASVTNNIHGSAKVLK